MFCEHCCLFVNLEYKLPKHCFHYTLCLCISRLKSVSCFLNIYWHICKSKSKLKSYFRTLMFFLYVRYFMSGLSSPSHSVAMATIHFSTTVASFYFSGLIMIKYQKDSCILDVLPSMVNKGLKSFFFPIAFKGWICHATLCYKMSLLIKAESCRNPLFLCFGKW